jgi:hypothetical protein
MKTVKTKTRAKPAPKARQANQQMTRVGNGKKVRKDLSHSPFKTINGVVVLMTNTGKLIRPAKASHFNQSGEAAPRVITNLYPGIIVPPTFHAIGTNGGASKPLNATLSPHGAGQTYQGTPQDQDPAGYYYDFTFTNVEQGAYSLSITNGDGMDPINVQ